MSESKSSLLHQIGRTSRAMYAAFESEVGLSLPRWRIMQQLRQSDSMTQKQLATVLQMDPAAMTRHMKSLEAEGWVSRLSDPQDNRLTSVVLTPMGKALLRDKAAQRDAFVNRALSRVSDDELQVAENVLDVLETCFRQMAKQGDAGK